MNLLIIFQFVSLICVTICLGHVQAQDVDKLKACDNVSLQMDGLKAANKILELRLEVMEQRLQRHQQDVEGKMQSLEEIIQKLQNQTGQPQKDHQINITTTDTYPSSCAAYNATYCAYGKCLIKNHIYGRKTFFVSCDNTTDGGGWTVIQRRINGSVDFYRNWSEYKKGFGNLDGEFWIGLDMLHALTTTLAPVELLIHLKDHNDIMKYARYGKFSIGSESEMYKLIAADDYEGNAGDSFGAHKGFNFTTKDKDNDTHDYGNCAVERRGAWWYYNCGVSNLNGVYHKTGQVAEWGQGIWWYDFHGADYSMKFVQMMIRPNNSTNNE